MVNFVSFWFIWLILVHFGSFWFILVHFGSFWFIWFILVHFGSFWLTLIHLVHLVHFGSFWFILVHLVHWFIFVHLVHLVNALIAILDNFTIKKSRKYFIEMKTFFMISLILQKFFEKSVREKIKSLQKNFR